MCQALKLILVLTFICLLGCQRSVIDARGPHVKVKKGRLHYQGEIYTGVAHVYFKNKKVKEVRNYHKGKKQGVQKNWYANGQLLWEETYEKGKKQGSQFGWHKNGEKRYLSNFQDGKKEGDQWAWHPNGQLASYHLVRGGHEIGYKQWRPDGKIFTNYVRNDEELDGVKSDEMCKTVSNY